MKSKKHIPPAYWVIQSELIKIQNMAMSLMDKEAELTEETLVNYINNSRLKNLQSAIENIDMAIYFIGQATN